MEPPSLRKREENLLLLKRRSFPGDAHYEARYQILCLSAMCMPVMYNLFFIYKNLFYKNVEAEI